MKILVGCEASGVVREAFRALGHEAWSCDVRPAEDGSPFHRQCDVLTLLDEGWGLAIFFPDCTYLTNSAEWAYKDPDFERYPGVGYHQRLKPTTLFGESRREARQQAIDFFFKLWTAPIPQIAIENPVGAISRMLKPTQIIQPWMFGDDASKATCLWLKGLPSLKATNEIKPRMVGDRPRWANQCDNGQNKLPPSEDRWKLRAKTYQGIANAFASQWSCRVADHVAPATTTIVTEAVA